MPFFRRNQSSVCRRVVILGVDGAPYTLIQRFIAEGVMPHFKRLLDAGTLKQMDTSLPEISSVAWVSFMTGNNPGQHGVYGFVDLQPQSYKLYFPNSRTIKSETIWGAIGRHGKRSIVVNVPTTYPASEMNGILISGFVAIDLAKATYPPALLPELKDRGYRIDVNTSLARESMEKFVADLFATHERRIDVIYRLYDREPWDLFIGVLTGTDRLQHFLWAAVEDPAHQFHEAFVNYYRKVDEFLGRMAGGLGQDDLLIVLSDHGFTRLDQQVYVNTWLREHGYLTLTNPAARTIEDIGDGSRAFAMDPSRIYINVKGRFPKGAVEPSDAPKLLQELKAGLASLEIDGRKVVQQIFEKKELYSGAQLGAAPDLVLLSHYGFDLKGAPGKSALHDRELFTGMHTRDDAICYVNSKALTNRRPHINDIAPTVLAALGVETAQPMDGVGLLVD